MLFAYTGLFVLSFLAATLLPLGSEAPLAVLVRSERQIFLPVLIATLGNYLGACTTYWLGRQVARGGGDESQDAEVGPTARAAKLLRRYGQPALLLSWVPLIGDALVAVAGATKLPFARFSFWVLPGKALRYLAVAWAASSI